jgi:ABC-2 type transport system permease protein
MTSLSLPTQPGLSARLRWQLSDSLVLARRNLAHVRQIPEKLLDVTLQPIMFVLLFSFVFGRVIHVPGGSYRQYLIGGILVQTLVFGLMGPGTSIAADLGEGIVDRFRSLPMSRSAYLFGHLIAEFAASALAITVLTLSGVIIGWRIHADVPHAVAGFALLLLISFTMLWVGTLVGIMVRSTDAVQGFAFMVAFPLTFLANTFVPADGLAGALRTVSNWNPVSAMAAAVRTLFGNPTARPTHAPLPMQHPVIAALLWCGALLAITVPLTIWRFRSRTTG